MQSKMNSPMYFEKSGETAMRGRPKARMWDKVLDNRLKLTINIH